MKRIHAAVALALGTMLVLAACSSPSDGGGGGDSPTVPQASGNPGKLTILVTDSPSATFLKAAAVKYTKKTGVDVEFVSVPNDQLPTKLILAGQAKQATFDIAQYDALTMPTIVPSGALAPLDKLIKNDKTYDLSDFPKALQDYSKYNDVSYGVPLSTEPFVNFYRKDMFESAGQKLPATWDQLVQQAASFQAAGNYGYCGYYGPALSARAYTEWLYSSGGRLLDPKTNKPLLNSKFAKEVMAQYISTAKFSPQSTYSSGQTGATTAFSQLNCAQMVAPAGWYGTLADPKSSKVSTTFATGAPPMSKTGSFDPKHILYGWLVGISAQSTHQAAAWKFLSFALGKDDLDTFLETNAPVTGRTSWMTNKDVQAKLPYVSSLQAGVEDGTVLPRIPELTEIMLNISQTLSSIQSGQVQLDPAMDQLNDKILSLLISTGRVKS